MKKIFVIWLVILLFPLSGFSNFRGGMMGRGGFMRGHQTFHERHRQFMFRGLPAIYRGKVNPLKNSTRVIKAGKELFIANCSSCHGITGAGNGPAGATLHPPPANLIFTMGKPIARDDFLYWTISEGGASFGTGMLPFKNILKEEQIWSIISYLRISNF